MERIDLWKYSEEIILVKQYWLNKKSIVVKDILNTNQIKINQRIPEQKYISIFELIFIIFFFFIFKKDFTIRIKGTLKSINWGL